MASPAADAANPALFRVRAEGNPNQPARFNQNGKVVTCHLYPAVENALRNKNLELAQAYLKQLEIDLQSQEASEAPRPNDQNMRELRAQLDAAQLALKQARAEVVDQARGQAKNAGESKRNVTAIAVAIVAALALAAAVTSGLLGHFGVGSFSKIPAWGQYTLYAAGGVLAIGLALAAYQAAKGKQTVEA